ncbi:ComEA family DNA-binding protein [Nocardia paucivorans]|uniref:ComEA family DNA-binding protein n=1 Tax=Nocardia paucivorans TaxID=114259 RepID=UPI001FDED1B2|nr:ComEA family DNA-binding protein [Nocardia paucivorans]
MSRHDERERIRQRLLGANIGSRAGTRRAPERDAGGKSSRREEPRVGRPEGKMLEPDELEPDELEPDEKATGRWHLDALPETDESDRVTDALTFDHASTPAGRDHDDHTVRMPGRLDEPPDTGWRERLAPERFREIRLDPGRRGVLAMVGIGLLAALVTAVVVLWERPVANPVPPLPPARPIAADEADPTKAPILAASSTEARSERKPAPELVVSVVGLVHRAGLVRLPPGSRVADALAAAGGVRAGADLTGLNLAQRLSDGDQVQVGAGNPDSGAHRYGSGTTSSGAAGSAGSGADSTPTSSAPIDLNTATEAELDALPGIGPVTARAIIAWRENNGRFTDIEQLGEVDGIGPGRLARLRRLVTV